ncbi:MAG: hypothetical protein ACRYF3_04200, partial [Janthinobacterium lividum]
MTQNDLNGLYPITAARAVARDFAARHVISLDNETIRRELGREVSADLCALVRAVDVQERAQVRRDTLREAAVAAVRADALEVLAWRRARAVGSSVLDPAVYAAVDAAGE